MNFGLVSNNDLDNTSQSDHEIGGPRFHSSCRNVQPEKKHEIDPKPSNLTNSFFQDGWSKPPTRH